MLYINYTTRVSIPGRPFPGRPGFPEFFHSRFPGNGIARFPEKTGIRKIAQNCNVAVYF